MTLRRTILLRSFLLILWDIIQVGVLAGRVKRLIVIEFFLDGNFCICLLLNANLLRCVIPNPFTMLAPEMDIYNVCVSAYYITNHGCVTDQCRNTPDRPSNMISVITECPFLNKAPAIAGSNANANDNEASDDDSGVGSS